MDNQEYTSFDDVSFERLKLTKVKGSEVKIAVGRKIDLTNHLEMLKEEYIGKTELEYYHACLIVFIRRNIEINTNLTKFYNLWNSESIFLCNNLSTRWLVSACDTIADHQSNNAESAMAICASLLVNTIKLYETEYLMLDNIVFSKQAPKPTQYELFDGITPFAVGKGDMVYNLISRIKNFKDKDLISYRILEELIVRIHTYNTVFKRMAGRHVNTKTNWTSLI